MKSMKFYVYFSNFAIIAFGLLFVGIGFSDMNYTLMGLGTVLGIHGITRLFRMLKALKQRDEDTLE